MKIVDLFAGCGGLSLGFQNAGFEIVAAFDNWEPALKVYRKNFPKHPAYQMDLSTVASSETILAICQKDMHVDMIIGGPPCQDFSSAGKRDESLGRADLTKAFARIVTNILPRWFVMENVERAQSSKAFAAARQIFADVGYGLSEVVLDASYCGVPQLRKRLFVIGEFGGAHGAITPYLTRKKAPKPMTMRDYFGNSLGIDHYYRHPRSYARRGVFSIDEPSPTVRGVNRPVPPTYQPHTGDTAPPSPQLRPLTTKERSTVQTFPESFLWDGSKVDLEQMIGNAVPVKLAEHVAHRICEYLEHGQIEQELPPLLLQSSFM